MSSWSDEIKRVLEAQLLSICHRKKRLIVCNPLLNLRFQSGIQKPHHWVIGYGPRQVGRGSVDLTIWDPLAPDLCFSLHPRLGTDETTTVLLKNYHPTKVIINHQHFSKKILEAGDRISFAETVIEVDFSPLSN